MYIIQFFGKRNSYRPLHPPSSTLGVGGSQETRCFPTFTISEPYEKSTYWSGEAWKTEFERTGNTNMLVIINLG